MKDELRTVGIAWMFVAEDVMVLWHLRHMRD